MPAKRDALFINSFARPPEPNTHGLQSRVITRPLVPSDMVAFGSQHSSTGPGLINQRLATTQYPGTKELLVPRDGVTPGWHEEFTNLIAQTKRSHILREEPPTLQHFMLEAPSIDFQVLRHMHAVALSEWQQENTDVFYITRNSINLAGPHHKSDLAMIELKFCCGDLRDGKGLLEFVTGFKPEGSVRVQAGLLRALDTKLSASSSLTQIQVHCDSLLHTWQKIRGNDIAHPEAFYHYLLESFPLEPESGKIPRLRGWMAEQVTEESSALATPTLFIAKIVLHAQLLRVPDSEERVHITTDNKNRRQHQQRQTLPTIFENDCDSCDAKCCASRKKGGRKACLCKHAHLALPEGATHGMKQFVALNRAYSLLHPTADLTKTSVEQMRAAVRKSKPAVLPVAQASETPDLSSDQMNLFRKWLAESQPPAGGVLMMTNNDYLPDPAQTTDGFSMLVSCEYCMLQHSPQSLWCALSMGMPERCPSPASGGCGRSQCERSCSCDMRQYIKEMDFRTKARVNLYESQKELHTILVQQEADALIYRAAAELVSRAVDDALTSLDRISSTHSLTAGRFSSTRSLTLSPHEALKRCVVCRSFPCKCRDDVEDECMICNEVPCVCNASGGALEHALRSGPSTNGPRDDSPTTGGEPPAWPLEQVVAELTHAAQPCGCRVDPRELHPLSGILLVAPTPHCAGFAFDPASALRMAAVTGGALQNSSVPIAAGCELCDTHFTCEFYRGTDRCDDGVPGCNCSQRGVSIGGAIPIGGADATYDDTTTDSELGACVGCCDTGSCVDGCNFALRLKRRRPVVRVSSDEWPADTFKCPALYKRGDTVQFVAPDRRIQLRTFGTIVAVTYSGATPLYVVATTNTTSKQYTLAEHMLSHRSGQQLIQYLRSRNRN